MRLGLLSIVICLLFVQAYTDQAPSSSGSAAPVKKLKPATIINPDEVSSPLINLKGHYIVPVDGKLPVAPPDPSPLPNNAIHDYYNPSHTINTIRGIATTRNTPVTIDSADAVDADIIENEPDAPTEINIPITVPKVNLDDGKLSSHLSLHPDQIKSAESRVRNWLEQRQKQPQTGLIIPPKVKPKAPEPIKLPDTKTPKDYTYPEIKPEFSSSASNIEVDPFFNYSVPELTASSEPQGYSPIFDKDGNLILVIKKGEETINFTVPEFKPETSSTGADKLDDNLVRVAENFTVVPQYKPTYITVPFAQRLEVVLNEVLKAKHDIKYLISGEKDVTQRLQKARDELRISKLITFEQAKYIRDLIQQVTGVRLKIADDDDDDDDGEVKTPAIAVVPKPVAAVETGVKRKDLTSAQSQINEMKKVIMSLDEKLDTITNQLEIRSSPLAPRRKLLSFKKKRV